jgi:uncharacterized protein (TIGR01777 family)
MRILISGGTGFIGSLLLEKLTGQGHECVVLSRQRLPAAAGISFVQSLDEIADEDLIDAVINLAGASLADKRWSPRYKDTIVSSRLDTTRDLVGLCKRLARAPAVFISGSAIGYYGSRGDEALEEGASAGEGFSSQLCQQWEQAAGEVSETGARLCIIRLGVVLDRDGGAFTEMSRSFRLGVASWMGTGEQYLSWIHRQDAVAAILFLLQEDSLAGVFNLTSPQPVTNREFCEGLKKQLRTLVTLPLPGPVMRVLVGEMADELLLGGQRVLPGRLQQSGFEFQYPGLDEALARLVQGDRVGG